METLSASARWPLWIVAFGFFRQTLDTTIVNAALPAMAHSLHQDPLQMYSVGVSCVLTVAVMLPVSRPLYQPISVWRRWLFCPRWYFATCRLTLTKTWC